MFLFLLALLLATPAQALPLLDSENTFSGTAMEAHDVAVRGDIAYVASENRFFTWDVSDPTNILPLGQLVMTEARGLDVDGTLALVADGNRFRAIDASNPAAPVQLDLVVQDEAVDVAANPAAKLAYVANSTAIGDIDVVDYTDPNNLLIVASVTAVSNPQGVFYANDTLYLADGLAGIKIYDVSGVVPVQTGFFSNGRFFNGITAFNGFIYAVDNTFGLTTLEETAGNPILRSAIAVLGSPKDVTADCTGLYLVTSIATSELRVYSLIDPNTPSLIDTTFIGGVEIESLDVFGDVVFTAGTTAGPKLALYDNDTFCDDTDGDGACLCGDPCPSFPNTLPLPEPFTVGDENGDGIPNECQCGDTNNDGFLTSTDGFNDVACGANPACPQGPPVIELWDTNLDGFLTAVDGFFNVSRGNAGTEYLNVCLRRPEGTEFIANGGQSTEQPLMLAVPNGDPNMDGIPTECQCGDANNNGSVDNNDLTTIFNCLTGNTSPAVCAANLATGKMEANNNGAIDNNDLTQIFQALNGDQEFYDLTCANRPEGTPWP